MKAKQIVKAISSMDLAELAPVFNYLAQRVYDHRCANTGFVPLEIFPFCIGIGGIYPCVEVIVETTVGGKKGYLLKRRVSSQEQGWQGQYQIPGVAARITDNPGKIFTRLSREIFGSEQAISLQYLGCEIHDEPERQAVCWTLVYRLKGRGLKAEELSGGWKFFTDVTDTAIIGHHQRTLAWAKLAKRPLLADLR